MKNITNSNGSMKFYTLRDDKLMILLLLYCRLSFAICLLNVVIFLFFSLSGSVRGPRVFPQLIWLAGIHLVLMNDIHTI